MVVKKDGQATELHRMQCEARTVLTWPKANRTHYLDLVEKKRGEAACAELKAEIMRQWRASQ